MNKALIATRFSDQKQIGGTSTEVQLKSCKNYCRSNNLKIIGYHIVEVESAKGSNLSRVDDLINFCRKYKGKVQYLVVYKVDRFARDVPLHYFLKVKLLAMGILLRSATEPIDESAQGEVFEGIAAVFAQYENRIKQERVTDSMKSLLDKGIWP